tara:strand:- start:3082 stop:3438 length:357 start_codon:yes stop_codon:yes gene_type:complete
MNKSDKLLKIADSFYKGISHEDNPNCVVNCVSACSYYSDAIKKLKKEHEISMNFLIDEIRKIRNENKIYRKENERQKEFISEIKKAFLKIEKRNRLHSVDWSSNHNFTHLNSKNWGFE